ncbi:MAG: hypothetical protein HY067_02330 [Betaproteobacteria bacterium]|nr:hypothetical protein [Betaproteobacteria bacterium]
MLTVTQRRIGLGFTLLLAIGLTVIGDGRSIQVEEPKPAPVGQTQATSVAIAETPARIEVAKLVRVPPAADGVDVFAPKSRNKPSVVRETIAPQPVAPPMPFQYVGQIEGREGPTVLLSRGEEAFSVRAGEPIDNEYRLESVTGETLTIVYLPFNERQTLNPEPK